MLFLRWRCLTDKMSVHFTVEQGIGRISMESPPTNSMNAEFLDRLSDAVRYADACDGIHAVMISSETHAGFSSGLDLGGVFSENDREQTAQNIVRLVHRVYEIIRRIVYSEKIYVTAVAGAAIGCGASLAVCGDICFADTSAWLWYPDVQYGGLLADGGAEILKNAAGSARARQMLLTNDRISSAEARDFGLFYRVVEEKRLLDAAFAFCRRISGYSGRTLAETKRICNSGALGGFQRDRLFSVARSEDTYKILSGYIHRKKEEYSCHSKERSQLFRAVQGE